MTSREEHLVELVDQTGRPAGVSSVAEAHQPPGRLHRAFSVLLVDGQGRVLLQRRAAIKTRFPLRWANSCCGHPVPGQSPTAAANLRLSEELGIGPQEMTEVGIYLYRAQDPDTGRVEFEYDHVLRADFSAGEPLSPNPAEVAELHWVDPTELMADLDRDPHRYAPWLRGVIQRLLNPVGSPTATPLADDSEPPGGR